MALTSVNMQVRSFDLSLLILSAKVTQGVIIHTREGSTCFEIGSQETIRIWRSVTTSALSKNGENDQDQANNVCPDMRLLRSFSFLGSYIFVRP